MASFRERVESEYEALEEILRTLPQSSCLQELSVLELAGVAALLHNFYNGVENILKQVFITERVPVPDGPAWHRDLPMVAVERAILSGTAVEPLRRFLAFRHFFSHGYALDLDPQRMESLVAHATATFAAVKEDIDSLPGLWD
jgi:hypothetical protein